MRLFVIVGMMIVVGFLFLGLLAFNLFLSSTAVQARADVGAQQNIVQLAQLLQSDIYAIGLEDRTNRPIVSARHTLLKFWGDVNNDGKAELVTYFTGPVIELSRTPNPRDFMLYRAIAPSETLEVASGLTSFDLLYFDSSGSLTEDPGKVRGIRIALQVESPHPYKDSLYSGLHWEQLFYPRNLTN